VSLAENPEPDTVTVDPSEPEFGLSDMDGTVIGSVGVVVVERVDWVNDIIVDVVEFVNSTDVVDDAADVDAIYVVSVVDVEEYARPFVVVELDDGIVVCVWARATEAELNEKTRASKATVMIIIMLTGLNKIASLQAKLEEAPSCPEHVLTFEAIARSVPEEYVFCSALPKRLLSISL